VPASTSPVADRPIPRSRRDAILDVALDLMSEHGASATSMRSLATACNVNVAALYHYFPSKADLLRSVIEERRYGLRLRDVPAVDVTLPPRERLIMLVLALWDGVREEEAIWRLLLGEALRGDETAAAVGSEILDALEPALRDWLVTLFTEPDGSLSVDPDAVATVLVSEVFSFFIGQLFRPVDTRELATRREAEALATLALAATPT
jgi:AcrR family transcriptional regulator